MITIRKGLVFLSILAMLSACGCVKNTGDAGRTGWVKYSNEDGKFKIDFPGMPTAETKMITTQVGDIEMNMFTFEKSATEAYLAIYSDYPSEMIKQSDPEKILRGAQQGALNSQNLTLKSEEKITMDGYPGYYYKAENETYFMVFKNVMKKNRLYQIIMLRDGSYPRQEIIDAFMGSFKLLE